MQIVSVAACPQVVDNSQNQQQHNRVEVPTVKAASTLFDHDQYTSWGTHCTGLAAACCRGVLPQCLHVALLTLAPLVQVLAHCVEVRNELLLRKDPFRPSGRQALQLVVGIGTAAVLCGHHLKSHVQHAWTACNAFQATTSAKTHAHDNDNSCGPSPTPTQKV